MGKKTKKLTDTFSIEDISLADFTILSCALSYNVFENIKKGKINFVNIPFGIKDSLLQTLSTFGYIESVDGFFKLTSITEKYLLEKSPENIIPLIKNAEWFWVLVDGPKTFTKGISLKDETYRAMIDISYKIGKKVIPELKRDFPILFNERLSVLDIGCGKMGVFSEIAKENKKLYITGVEKNEYALNYLGKIKRQLGKRFKIEKQDVEKLKYFKDHFDVIFLSHIIHWIREGKIESLLEFCKKQLKNDGLLLIYEDLLREDFTPKEGARKNLILSFLGFRIPTEKELKFILKKHNFNSITSKVIDKRRILVSARS